MSETLSLQPCLLNGGGGDIQADPTAVSSEHFKS
jgi:hypothetical protein